MPHFFCPNCQVKLKFKPHQVGYKFACPKCRMAVTVPADGTTLVGSGASVAVAGTSALGGVSIAKDAPVSRTRQAAWQAGKLLLDDYEVKKRLGQGGMGEVYLVQSRSSGEQWAAKRILPELLRKKRSRNAFLQEVRNWIDLPTHPHLTACRFFLTVDDQVVVFAEYVEGGSLEEWIRDKRLSSLEQVLDVAIQFAWGLETAHQRGLVHQDVKPSNVLMTRGGTPKVTDFGLAKAHAVVKVVEAEVRLIERALVTGAAGTPAYHSPEQAAGERLSVQTDVWSWGLSVLALFIGERSWHSGVGGGRILEARLKAAKETPNAFFVRPPTSVVDVLRRCFQRTAADRWPSIGDAANAMKMAYERKIGPYPRRRPAVSVTSTMAPTHDRCTTTGVTWEDPRAWLRSALNAAGQDPAEADRFGRPRQ